MSVRPATAADARRILAVHQASVRALACSHYTLEQIEAWIGHNTPANYVRALESGEQMWVADIDGVVLGFSARTSDEIRAVYVHPDGTGRGLGRELLRAAEQSAHEDGVVRLHLDASLNAAGFYERMGYRPGPVSPHRLADGTVIPSVPMARDLDQRTRRQNACYPGGG